MLVGMSSIDDEEMLRREWRYLSDDITEGEMIT
nr:MAG TPA: hypothetical protein [Caudoviricetes sp.]